MKRKKTRKRSVTSRQSPAIERYRRAQADLAELRVANLKAGGAIKAGEVVELQGGGAAVAVAPCGCAPEPPRLMQTAATLRGSLREQINELEALGAELRGRTGFKAVELAIFVIGRRLDTAWCHAADIGHQIREAERSRPNPFDGLRHSGVPRPIGGRA